MGLRNVLEKMKLIEPEAAGASPARPVAPPASGRSAPASAKSTASLDDLLRDVPTLRVADDDLARAQGSSGDAIPDFAAIYKAAGIADPRHGFGAYKVLEILSSPEFAGLDARARASTLSGFLKMNPSGPVPIREVIQDAVQRDQALDRFEEFLRKKLESRAEEVRAENARLQAEMDALARKNRERMEASEKAIESERRRFADWQGRKQAEEEKLYRAVEPFVENNPVSARQGAPAPPRGAG
ncbi:MAG TPA: hypothetical protein VIA29_10300 [Thermoanaerobaculia bacterium]|jgi:hypothetical protein